MRIAIVLVFELVNASLCQLTSAKRLVAAITTLQPAAAMAVRVAWSNFAPDAPELIVHDVVHRVVGSVASKRGSAYCSQQRRDGEDCRKRTVAPQ
jgi:hypothetical protein